jgi:hypothetical protein
MIVVIHRNDIWRTTMEIINIENINSFSLEDVYEYVASHMKDQGIASTSPKVDGFFSYYGEEGRRCPVGILIPEKDYDESVELMSVEDIFIKYKVNEDIARLLRRFVYIHDNCSISEIEKELLSIEIDILQ